MTAILCSNTSLLNIDISATSQLDDTPQLKVNPEDLLGREEAGEEQAAKVIVDVVLACSSMTVEEARVVVETAGKGWDQPGVDMFSADDLCAQLHSSLS